jgi:hypothetical protein
MFTFWEQIVSMLNIAKITIGSIIKLRAYSESEFLILCIRNCDFRIMNCDVYSILENKIILNRPTYYEYWSQIC